LKSTGAKNLAKSVKVALWVKDKFAKGFDELLKWIKDLNPGLNMEHWRVLDRDPLPRLP
jgi:hypothetical protein